MYPARLARSPPFFIAVPTLSATSLRAGLAPHLAIQGLVQKYRRTRRTSPLARGRSVARSVLLQNGCSRRSNAATADTDRRPAGLFNKTRVHRIYVVRVAVRGVAVNLGKSRDI